MRRGILNNIVIVGGRVEAGGLRVLECKIQGCSVKVEGGGGRRAIKWAATASSCPERRG